MDKIAKKLVCTQLQVFFTKYPTAPASDAKKFLLTWKILLKDEVSKKAPVKDLKMLKRIIRKKWKEVHADKDLLKRMIASVPARVEAMIKLNGVQVHKSDYEKKKGSGDG